MQITSSFQIPLKHNPMSTLPFSSSATAAVVHRSSTVFATSPCFSSVPFDSGSFSKLIGSRLKCEIGVKNRGVRVVRTSLDDVAIIDLPSPSSDVSKSEIISSLKLNLLSAVSGLNRGLAASEDDLRKADSAAKELENSGGPVDLITDFDKLQGRWKLIYSSAFSGRTLGGSRPGPPTGRLLPITLGQVFQRIDVLSKDFDNIVELELGAPWPFPPIEVTATLAHKFELIGSAAIRITFEKTSLKTTGNLAQLPPFELPKLPDGLRPPSNTGSGEFEVTYIDDSFRVTRGDRGELRVFVIS